MTPIEGSIIVRVDLEQKGSIRLGGQIFLKVPKFNTNYRDKSPVVAIVECGNSSIQPGTLILTHHNLFQGESIFYLEDDLYSIPFNSSIFATIDSNGDLCSIQGNIIVERIAKKDGLLETPASYRKNYNDRVIVLSDGEGFKKGDQILTCRMADYEMVYNWNGVERRVIKVLKRDIVAVLKK